MGIVTIGALLECRTPCVLSASSSAPNPSAKPAETLPSRNSGHVEENVSGKRRPESETGQIGSSVKKRRAAGQAIRVLPQNWEIIGRLQLHNWIGHSRHGLQVPPDCLALTDSTGTICCFLCESTNPSVLGGLVRVTSWSYVPGRSITVGHANPAPSHANNSSASTWSANSSERQGYLEVHKFDVLEDRPASPHSLYVKPLPADDCLRGVPGGMQGGEVNLHGLPVTMSPAFEFSTKETIHNGEQGSNCPRKPLLGIFLELKVHHTSRTVPEPHGQEQGEVRRVQKLRHGSDDAGQEGAGSAAQLPDSEVFRSEFSVTMKAEDEQNNADVEKRGNFENGGSKERLRSRCVFFTGSVSAWRPVLSGVLGRHHIIVTALKKRRVLSGLEKRPHDIFVATRKSLVFHAEERNLFGGRVRISPLKARESKDSREDPHLGRGLAFDAEEIRMHELLDHEDGDSSSEDVFLRAHSEVEQCNVSNENPQKRDGSDCLTGDRKLSSGHGDVNFFGVVTDVLFQGTLVELDKRVWLLLTHHRHAKMHGLRVGALVSIRNAHAKRIRDVEGKVVLLGACLRSHVSVVRFSPLSSTPLPHTHSRSLLLKLIQHLPFISSFWLLSIIQSFQSKFRDIHSEKRLLGSKKERGLIQKYAERMIGLDVALQRDFFKEFFLHESCCHLGDSSPSSLPFRVPPIHHFCRHIEALWKNHRSGHTHVSSSAHANLQGKCMLHATQGCPQPTKMTIKSQELGVTLIGCLKICQSSRKLQMGDATGAVDVVIPGLISSEHLFKTYQVSHFTVVVEGLCAPLSSFCPCRPEPSPICWSALLKYVEREPPLTEGVTCRVHFNMNDAVHIEELHFGENTVQSRSASGSGKCDGRQRFWLHTKSCFNNLWKRLQSFSGRVIANNCTQALGIGLLSGCTSATNRGAQLFQISCKVNAVRLLVLERTMGSEASERGRGTTSPQPASAQLTYSTPRVLPALLGCFIVDDGSGPADCWALGDVAALLLGLHSPTPERTFAKLTAGPAKLFAENTFSHLAQKYEWVIFQNRSVQHGSEMPHVHIFSACGEILSDDKPAILAVAAMACKKRPLVLTLGSIPTMNDPGLAACKDLTGQCRINHCNRRHRQDQEYDRSRAVLFAYRASPEAHTQHLKVICDQVAGMLR